MAACQLKSNRSDLAIKNCSHCLSIDHTSVKALFRRGQAYANLKDYEKASIDYQNAEQLAPNDTDIKKKISALKELERQYKVSQKQYAQNLQKMFQS